MILSLIMLTLATLYIALVKDGIYSLEIISGSSKIIKIGTAFDEAGMKSEIGLIRICRILFISAVAFTPLSSLQVDWIPSFIKMFLGYEDKLSMYPLLILSIIWFVWEARRKRLKDYVPILLFFAAYFLINIAVVIHGDLIFPYYELIEYALF